MVFNFLICHFIGSNLYSRAMVHVQNARQSFSAEAFHSGGVVRIIASNKARLNVEDTVQIRKGFFHCVWLLGTLKLSMVTRPDRPLAHNPLLSATPPPSLKLHFRS